MFLVHARGYRFVTSTTRPPAFARSARSLRCVRPSRGRLTQGVEHDRIDLLDAVDAFLEVRGARPVGERLLQVAVVTQAPQPLAELAREGFVDVEPVLRRRCAEELLMQSEQTAELRDRPFVVV